MDGEVDGVEETVVQSFRLEWVLRWLFAAVRIYAIADDHRRTSGTKGLIKVLFTVHLVADRVLYGDRYARELLEASWSISGLKCLQMAE